MPRKCIVRGCHNLIGSKSFYYLPIKSDPLRVQQWLDVLQIENVDLTDKKTTKMGVCQDHFADSDFTESRNGNRRLSRKAVPRPLSDKPNPTPTLTAQTRHEAFETCLLPGPADDNVGQKSRPTVMGHSSKCTQTLPVSCIRDSEQAYRVDEKSLLVLFRFCFQCHKEAKATIERKGEPGVEVRAECQSGHVFVWNSIGHDDGAHLPSQRRSQRQAKRCNIRKESIDEIFRRKRSTRAKTVPVLEEETSTCPDGSFGHDSPEFGVPDSDSSYTGSEDYHEESEESCSESGEVGANAAARKVVNTAGHGKPDSWTTENLKLALAAVRSGKSLSQASRKFGIPRSTIWDRFRKGSEKELVRNHGRNPVFTPEMTSQLKQKIVRFQQIGFSLTRSMVREEATRICAQLKMKTPFTNGKAGRSWFCDFIKRNPDIIIGVGESIRDERLKRFNQEAVRHFFTRLRSACDSLKPEAERIYAADATVLQFGEGEAVTVVACVNASGSNWIPPMLCYKGQQMTTEREDAFPPGSSFHATPDGSVSADLMRKFLQHFKTHHRSGPSLLIIDGLKLQLDEDVLDTAESHDVRLLCLPANCHSRLHVLDKGLFQVIQSYWTQAVSNCRPIRRDEFPKHFAEAWRKAATSYNAVLGFQATGIYPLNPDCVQESDGILTAVPRKKRTRKIEPRRNILVCPVASTSNAFASVANVQQVSEKGQLAPEVYCRDCGGQFWDGQLQSNCLQCSSCKMWYHATCDSENVFKVGICTLCSDTCALFNDGFLT